MDRPSVRLVMFDLDGIAYVFEDRRDLEGWVEPLTVEECQAIYDETGRRFEILADDDSWVLVERGVDDKGIASFYHLLANFAKSKGVVVSRGDTLEDLVNAIAPLT